MIRGLKLCGLLVALLALALTPALSVDAKPNGQFNEKFTFEDVTFENPDGTVTTDGIIEAGSKQTGGGDTYTVCNYYTEGYQTYLGQFLSDEFASDDPGEVREFCLENAANRQ